MGIQSGQQPHRPATWRDPAILLEGPCHPPGSVCVCVHVCAHARAFPHKSDLMINYLGAQPGSGRRKRINKMQFSLGSHHSGSRWAVLFADFSSGMFSVSSISSCDLSLTPHPSAPEPGDMQLEDSASQGHRGSSSSAWEQGQPSACPRSSPSSLISRLWGGVRIPHEWPLW